MTRTIIALLVACTLAAPAAAQDWPTRPITLVVPYAAGGPVDTIARILTARMSELLGQQIVVENMGGAGGMTGAPDIPALRVRDLRAGYGGGGDIVCGIDLDQAPETILALIGPNGSGKSTFVKTVAGLLRPRTGSIAITGRDVTALSPAERVAAGLAYVPQEANVFRGLTIGDPLDAFQGILRGVPIYVGEATPLLQEQGR